MFSCKRKQAASFPAAIRCSFAFNSLSDYFNVEETMTFWYNPVDIIINMRRRFYAA